MMNRYLPTALTFAVFAYTILMASFHLDDPLVTDETMFAVGAKTISEGGYPYAYSEGVLKPFIGHPPTYHYLLSLVIWIGDWGGRALGLTFMVVTALLVYLLLPKLWPSADDWSRLMAVSIILLCPLTIPASLLLDIDGGLLTLVLLLCALATAHYLRHPTRKSFLLTALAFTGAFLVKLTTPLAAVPALLIYALVERKKRPLKALLALLLGAGTAALILMLYYGLWGKPLLAPLSIIGWKLGGGGGVGLLSSAGDYLSRQIKIIYWLSPFLCILILTGWIRTFRPLYRRGLFPATFGWMILIGYLLVGGDAYGLCKYQMVAVPMLALAIAHPLRELAGALSPGRKLLFFSAGLLLLPYFHFLVGDLLHAPFTRTEMINLGDITAETANNALIFQTITTLIAFILLVLLWSCKRDKLVIVPLVMFISMGVVQQLKMGRADYSIGYNYGEEKMMEAVTTVKHYLPAKGLLLCPSDIAYYVGYDTPHREITQVFGCGELAGLLTQPPPKVLVIRASYLGHNGFAGELEAVKEILAEYAQIRVGYFIIYFPQASSP